ncbi:hypothetical protein ACIBO5_22040 [Nonomuraea angiospora]|uniref:hypothetical protein n=1 Tax=Nonomuraea angiospora TaxID=46172 RepID=UPI0029B14E3F|nr:hypothetical protein [Nonomuraea angiospora]MDX3103859.1 hypothetical protein [Nonomuraea angiospora]
MSETTAMAAADARAAEILLFMIAIVYTPTENSCVFTDVYGRSAKVETLAQESVVSLSLTWRTQRQTRLTNTPAVLHSDRAALIYQHATKDADQRIADALSARVEAERKDRRP